VLNTVHSHPRTSKHEFWLASMLPQRKRRISLREAELRFLPSWLPLQPHVNRLICVRSLRHPNLVHISVSRATPRFHALRALLGRGGCVVDTVGLRVMAYGGPEAKLVNNLDDWEKDCRYCNVVVVEKMCGVSCMMYCVDGKWEVCSATDADGEAIVYDKTSVRDLCLQLLGRYKRATLMNPRVCYHFIVSPSHRGRFMVRHAEEDSIALVGARDMDTGHELYVWRIADELQIPCAPVHVHLRSRHDTRLAIATSTNPFASAGFMVYDTRTKEWWDLPSAAYVSVTCTTNRSNIGYGPLGNLSGDHVEAEDVALMLHRNQLDVFEMWYGSKWAALIASVRGPFEANRNRIEKLYESLTADSPPKKDFAARAKKQEHSSVLFDLFDGKAADVGEAMMLQGREVEMPVKE
jgi:hypothetical protein